MNQGKTGEGWRLEVLDRNTAGKGLVRSYHCSFIIDNHWPYGIFHPQECCELPGKLFIARASAQKGCGEAFLTAAFNDFRTEHRYNLQEGKLFVAWRVRAPDPSTSKRGKVSFVRAKNGSWQMWCNRDQKGDIEWIVSLLRNSEWEEHRLKGWTLDERTVEPSAYGADREPRVVDDWMDVQLVLEPQRLTVILNHEEAGSFPHDPYSGEFLIQFGSALGEPSDAEVVSTYREVYIDDVPYPYEKAAVEPGPEDVRPEDDLVSFHVCPATASNPRQSEADLIGLKNGDLLLAYSDYYQSRAQDWAPARVSTKISKDGGRSWSEPRVIHQRDESDIHPTPDVSLVYTAGGDLLLAYHDKLPGMQKDSSVLLRSHDDGQSWEGPEPIVLQNGRECAANNGCFRTLSSGRIILSCRHSEGKLRRPFAIYSDDDGQTWRAGSYVPNPDIPQRLKDLQNINEPSIAELSDGRLLMTMRTVAGGQYFSYSSDGGETWTDPYLSPLLGVCSPAVIRRIPDTEDILAVWNYGTGARTPLNSAISSDGGASWRHLKLVEQSKHFGYDYPSLTFIDDKVYLTYGIYPVMTFLEKIKVDTEPYGLKLTVLPISWFYRQES